MDTTPIPGVHQQRRLDNVVSVNGNTRQAKSSGVEGSWLGQMVRNFLHLPPKQTHCSEARRAEAAKLLQAV